MRYDLQQPCTNCPFRKDDTRIRFGARERAEEIEEHAYRNGFPCHVSSEVRTDLLTGEEGFVAGENTQHCAGYLMMQIQDSGGGTPWPGIGNDEDLLERITARLNSDVPVFESSDEFLDANTPPASTDGQSERNGRD